MIYQYACINAQPTSSKLAVDHAYSGQHISSVDEDCACVWECVSLSLSLPVWIYVCTSPD